MGECRGRQLGDQLQYLRDFARDGLIAGHNGVAAMRDLLFHRLHVDEAFVVAVEGNKLVVRAAFHDFSFVHHTDEVGVANRRQAVSNYERGAILHKSVESFLY